MKNYLDIALIIISVLLILSVILQSKGAGLGGLTGADTGSLVNTAHATAGNEGKRHARGPRRSGVVSRKASLRHDIRAVRAVEPPVPGDSLFGTKPSSATIEFPGAGDRRAQR